MKKAVHASPPAGEFRAAASQAPEVRLSDAAMSHGVSELRDRLREDPMFSLQLLRNAGIVNSKGRLAKSFGG